MSVTTISSEEFKQQVKEAQKASNSGPVFITHDGEPAQVLLSIEEYRQITAKHGTIVDRLVCPDADDIDFEPEKLSGSLLKPASFS